jgi:hypothetical protein
VKVSENKNAFGPALAALMVFATGCSTATRVYVKSTDQTNDGNTLYMMVRSVGKKTVITESYQEAAAKLFTDPPDPSVIASQPIFPGNTVSINVDNADTKDLVIYFFFTQFGANWKVPLHKPLPAEIYIDLGQHEVDRVQIRKR